MVGPEEIGPTFVARKATETASSSRYRKRRQRVAKGKRKAATRHPLLYVLEIDDVSKQLIELLGWLNKTF